MRGLHTMLATRASPARALAALAAAMLAACSPAETGEAPRFGFEAPQAGKIYVFSVHPLHNPARLNEIFGPLMDLLTRELPGSRFRLEASRNYAAYNEKLVEGQSHFSLPNPYQTLLALEHGYRVFGKMGDDENFRGIILVRRDSGIRTPADLRGKAVSYPAPSALAATMLPQYFLHSHGVDVRREVENRYVGSQESSIMNVYLGETAAGATWPPPWRALSRERPELAQALEVKWQTDPLPNNGLVVRADVPEDVVRRVAQVLFALHTHDRGREILARMELSRFEPADANTYDPVRAFLERFGREIRDPRAKE